MKIKIPTSKKVFSFNFLTRLPSVIARNVAIGRGLGWGFLFLLSTTLQAQKIAEPNLPRITDSLKTIFYKNAKQAKLTDEKTIELLKIIDERNKTISSYNAKKNRNNASFSVMDPSMIYTYKIEEAKKYYSKKIKNLLTYDQYFQFVSIYFIDEAEQKTKEEFEQILQSNPSLTQEQKEKLHKLIYWYYLNLKTTTSYYNGDINLQKAKQGAMTFSFEKKLAETCKEMNIKMDKLNKSSANNFQWN